MADNVVEILFGVAGGSRISGQSGTLIKSQLDTLASKINLKINVDKNYFSKQLTALKKDMDKKLGRLKIQVVSQGGGIEKKKTAESEQEQKPDVKLYDELKSKQEALYASYKKLDSERNTSTKKYAALLSQTNALADEYNSKLSAARQDKSVTDDQLKQLQQRKEYLERVRKAQLEVNAAMDQDKMLGGMQTSYDGLIAKVTALRERYSDLIAHNKDAAIVMENLEDMAKKPYAGVDYIDEAGNKIPASMTEAGNQIREMSQALRIASGRMSELQVESDTLGNKLRKAFDSRVLNVFSYAMIGLVIASFKKVFDNVVELDKAITDLQIATGYTRDATAELVKSYAQLANQLGATITEVASGADTWLRQGYNIAEANDLIASSMMLAKLGQLSAAEASKALTSAMKGYKVEVKDCTSIVDKFTAVDMEAAVSAGDIATAMAETAASADIAGVSMDTLIGYIATVAEVTQDGAESVGTFFKTLFARMGNVKAGKFVDDETGENLNDVEKVLDSLGISLRDEQGLFRNFAVVLDEVGAKWDSYTNVQQHAIATAFAGTRQQEKFIVLMENYGDALNYASIAANSLGTAENKYNAAYLDSIDAKLNTLKASWQEFSMLILDSDIVKSGADFLNWIVQILNKIAGFGDGILITIPAITVALYALWAILLKIKSTTVFTTMFTGLKSLLAIFPAILLGLKSIYLRIVAEIAARRNLTTAMSANVAATKAATAANQAFNATNPVGWIILAVSAVLALVNAFANLGNGAADASAKAKEAAENAKDVADSAKEDTADLVGLIDEYKKAVEGIDDVSNFSADTRQKVLDIQTKITKLVGEEAANINLVNDGLNTSLDKLSKLQAETAKTEYEKALASYSAAKNSSDAAYETSYADIGGMGKGFIDNHYQISFERGKDASKYADEIYKIIAGMDERILISKDSTLGDKFYGVNLNTSSAQESIEVLNELISKIEKGNYAVGSSDIYNQFVSLRDAYQKYVDSENEATDSLIESAVSMVGWDNTEAGQNIDSVETYRAFRDMLIEQVSSNNYIAQMLQEGVATADDVANQVDNWLSKYYSDWYDKENESNGIVQLKSYLDILKDMEGSFDALSEALESVTENGIVAKDAISKLLEEYPELEKYFKLTDQGFVLDDAYAGWSTADVLQDFTSGYLQKYVDELAACEEGTDNYKTAQENLNNAIAVCATLLRSQAIKEATEEYEKQQDALEEQLDGYKELVDARKELLQTYKEEVDYQKELAKKQNQVIDLQTQLSLARMDTSAAGQTRVRELEEQLAKAKEELEDYTLENAIDTLSKQIDSGFEEYEKFIQTQLDEIKQAIENIEKNIKVEVDVPSPTPPEEETEEPEKPVAGQEDSPWRSYQDAADAGFSNIATQTEWARRASSMKPKYGDTYQDYLNAMYKQYVGSYHTGGFVGGITSLQSNEEFAKLMRGEFVSTPKQMDTFMKKTFPNLVFGGQNNAVINNNSPLIEIKCGEIDQDTLPRLRELVNQAVAKIGKNMESALARTGYKKQY